MPDSRDAQQDRRLRVAGEDLLDFNGERVASGGQAGQLDGEIADHAPDCRFSRNDDRLGVESPPATRISRGETARFSFPSLCVTRRSRRTPRPRSGETPRKRLARPSAHSAEAYRRARRTLMARAVLGRRNLFPRKRTVNFRRLAEPKRRVLAKRTRTL